MTEIVDVVVHLNSIHVHGSCTTLQVSVYLKKSQNCIYFHAEGLQIKFVLNLIVNCDIFIWFWKTEFAGYCTIRL
jgi:hypothetical protein